MTIDKETGVVMLPEIGASIAGSLSRSQFLEAPEFSGAFVFARCEPWCRYRLPLIPQTSTDLIVVLHFHGETLALVEFCHGSDRFGRTWDDWSEEHEMARKAFHERWLVEDVGVGPGYYLWGKITSYFDPIVGNSAVALQYADGKL